MTRFSPVFAGGARVALLAGTAAIALGTPGIAFAQDAEDDVAMPAETGNQIVVTATKREQTLQEVPVAVTVTTAETLEREQIRDLKDLQSVVPSLRVTTLQSSANTNFIIRGFGNGANNAGIEPSVGVFVDGVYRSRTAAQISDLPDVARIEVLRGPQSTLFGKNASAGVISIVTKEPSFTPEGSVELSYGNYDAIVGKASVSGPASDSLAFSLAGGFNFRDGYNRDLATGNRTNERSRWFVRGQGLFDNGGPLKVRVIADYDKIDENCCGVVNLQSSAATAAILAIGGQVTDPNDPFANVVYNNFDATNQIENYGISAQIDYDVGDNVTLTSITSYRETNGVFDQDVDFTSADLVRPRFQDQSLETFTQEVRFTGEFGPVTALLGAFYFDESVSEDTNLGFGNGFRPYANILVQGATGGALNIGSLNPSQDLELIFGALDGNPLQYVGTFFAPGISQSGNFMLDNEALSIFGQFDVEVTDGLVLTLGGNYTTDKKQLQTNYASFDTFSAIDFDAPQYAPFRQQLLFQGALAAGVGSALGLGRSATQAEITAFATGASPAGAAGATAFATVIQPQATAFASANANNPAANPLNGLTSLQLNPPFLNVPNAVESGRTKDNDFSYTVRLAYDVSPSLNVYASYATGFKASSFNLSRDSRPLASDAAALAGAGLLLNNLNFGSRFAGPEESKVIEVGFKGNWGRYSANLTGFRQDIDGFQSNVFTGTGFALANAGKQRTYGVEFEGMANPIDPLTLNLAVTWLDPEYLSFPASAIGDISGFRPAGIPEWTVVLGAQWDQELASGDRLIARSTFHFEDEVQIVDGLPGFLDGGQAAAIAAAAPFTRQVDELSASLTYVFTDMGLELSVWGRNLTNDRYLLSIFDSVAQEGAISGYPNQPRTYGVSGRLRF